jgi:hypothetical protein
MVISYLHSSYVKHLTVLYQGKNMYGIKFVISDMEKLIKIVEIVSKRDIIDID